MKNDQLPLQTDPVAGDGRLLGPTEVEIRFRDFAVEMERLVSAGIRPSWWEPVWKKGVFRVGLIYPMEKEQKFEQIEMKMPEN